MLRHGSPSVNYSPPAPRRIISGGQTGVDRAALDVARALGISCGGWCPRGRLAEDGPIHPRYPLTETSNPEPAVRTGRNVAGSDGTLILTPIPLSGGTALTRLRAGELGRPCLVANPEVKDALPVVASWLGQWPPGSGVVNVAGPRESEHPGVYQSALQFMTALWSAARR